MLLSFEEASRVASFMESTRPTLPPVGHSTLVGKANPHFKLGSMFNPILMEWMGVFSDGDLDLFMPNRHKMETRVNAMEDVFRTFTVTD